MSDQTSSVQIMLSVEQLKSLIRDAVHEALLEMRDEDASSKPRFAPQLAERLRRYKHEKPIGIPIDQVEEELGFNS